MLPYLRIEDLDEDTFREVHDQAKAHNRGIDPWAGLDNHGLLKTLSMWRRDPETGHEGYTVAALLCFGKEEIIKSAMPQYKTDVLCRIRNTELYDDREDVRCNLVKAYRRISAFLEKYLPEWPYIEGDTRVSLREVIFREVIINLLVHREFSNAYPATLTIWSDRVETKNWTLPHQMGELRPETLSPMPKNPVIAMLFSKIGWVEELGSGTRKMFKYTPKIADGQVPMLVEGDVFEATVPFVFPGVVDENTHNVIHKNVEEMWKKYGRNVEEVIRIMRERPDVTLKQIADEIGISHSSVEKQVKALREAGAVGFDKGWTLGCKCKLNYHTSRMMM